MYTCNLSGTGHVAAATLQQSLQVLTLELPARRLEIVLRGPVEAGPARQNPSRQVVRLDEASLT
jgi:hypothetical protein